MRKSEYVTNLLINIGIPFLLVPIAVSIWLTGISLLVCLLVGLFLTSAGILIVSIRKLFRNKKISFQPRSKSDRLTQMIGYILILIGLLLTLTFVVYKFLFVKS